MKLYIGNKNYSSWSMRPWVLLRHFNIPFEEVLLRFDSFDPKSKFKTHLAAVSPTGKVPALVDEDLVVWDTLAIAEYLAERHPELPLWPADRKARAQARSYCAEMHSGFGALREHCAQNIEASLPDVGARLLRAEPGVVRDLQRVESLWSEALKASGGPFLFGDFSIVDAYYAPVVGRLRTYGLPVSPTVQTYMDRIWQSPGVSAWVADALNEHDFVPFEEPYRSKRDAQN